MGSRAREAAVGLVVGLLVAAAVAAMPPAASGAPPGAPVGAAATAPAARPGFRPSLTVPTAAVTHARLAAAGLGPSLPAVAAAGPTPSAISSPVVRASWRGLGPSDNAFLANAGTVAPPDVQVAAGPNHVVEMVNLAVSIWSKQGLFLQNKSLMTFFGVSQSEFISDPKVQYDAASGRWFASVTDVETGTGTATGQVWLAVSASSDPTTGWRIYGVPSSPTGECLDQPILGVGNRTVVVSVNVFSTCLSNKFTYSGAQFWVLSKADLVSGVGSPAIQSFGPYASTASFHPAQVASPSPVDYMVSANAFQTSVNSIELFRIAGTPPSASVSTTNLTVRAIASPPAATQPGGGGTQPLDTGDFRVLDATWSAGALWLTLGDSCTPAGDTQARSCVRLIEINTTSTTVVQDFDVGAAGQYYLYPSLRADGSGSLMVVFGYSSAADYPGLMAAGRIFGDPLGHLDPPSVIVAGTADESLGCSSSTGSCRYGDYFGTALDPSNASMIWAAGEFGDPSGWATQIFAGSVKAVLTLNYSIVNGGTGYEIPKLSYVLDGTARSAALAAAPTSFAADPGTAWSVPLILHNPSLTMNQYEIWMTNGSVGGPPTAGTVNTSFTQTFLYFHMYEFTFGFSTSDQASAPPPMVQIQTWGLHAWVRAESAYYVDAGSSFDYPASLNQSTARERWTLEGIPNGTVSGPGLFEGLYYHEYLVTFEYLVSGGSSGFAPSVAYVGMGANLSVTANATVWADAGTAYTFAPSLGDPLTGTRMGAESGAVGTVVASGTITVTYTLQYLLAISIEPGALTGNVTGAGWYNAGSVATMAATAPGGWRFMGWSGGASGSDASTSVTMNGPVNVVALFYPGLTITAGNGGSVAYSYASVSGVVPAGTSLTIYAPAGTTITLTAQPDSTTSAFVSWSGGASGSASTASVTLNAPLAVSAAFGTNVLVVAGIGIGVVAVILAALVLILLARRRRKQPPA